MIKLNDFSSVVVVVFVVKIIIIIVQIILFNHPEAQTKLKLVFKANISYEAASQDSVAVIFFSASGDLKLYPVSTLVL